MDQDSCAAPVPAAGHGASVIDDHFESFRQWLVDVGYGPSMVRAKLRILGVLAFWMRARGMRARYNFAAVSRAIGLRQPTVGYRHGRGPRLHDMRHRFAVRNLVRWYREGRDVEREFPKLSTYLGHVRPAYTYWYIEAVPELLELATQRAAHPQERSL